MFDTQHDIIRDDPYLSTWVSQLKGHPCFKILLTTGGADKSLARPTSQYILFDGENISFDACLIYIYIPPVMIIDRIYENQNLLSL